MKGFIYFLIKKYIGTALLCYYKKIKLYGLENVPKNKPILYLPNHQNALMDPLIIAAFDKKKPYFLTRADVFTNAVLNTVFNLLRMLPIYRMRDGKDTLGKNRVIFDKCSRLLQNNKAILIFPEANHNIKRRVRTLSKGFTRIVFNALQKNPEIDIRLVPVGINYRDAAGFPDAVSFYFGEDLKVKDLYDGSDIRKSTDRIKEIVSDRIKKLTTHIEDEEDYESILEQLDALGADYLKPQKVNAMIEGLSPNKNPIDKKRKDSFLAKVWDVIFFLFNFPVVLFWRGAIKKRVPEIEFMSTYRFLFSLLFYPVYYLILLFTMGAVANFSVVMTIVLGLFIFNLCYVKLR